MSAFGWVPVLIRCIGVLIAGIAIPSAFRFVAGNGLLAWRGELNLLDAPRQLAFELGSLVQLATGLYLLFGGRALVRLCLRASIGFCPRCGYDVSRTNSDSCSECGFAVRSTADAPNPPTP
ncbi:MAG: hypothetical protein K2Q20_09735 [Phycisphaerales bacterium]|nr:hypothetical protein [Phycisphaerales bacterium]